MIPCALAACRLPFDPRPGQKYHRRACGQRASALRRAGGFRLPRGRPHPLISAALKIVAWAERRTPATVEAWGVGPARRRAGNGKLYDKIVHFV